MSELRVIDYKELIRAVRVYADRGVRTDDERADLDSLVAELDVRLRHEAELDALKKLSGAHHQVPG